MLVYNQISQNIFKTWFYLTLFAGIIFGLGWFLSYYYNSPNILVFALLISIISPIVSYWFSDKIVLTLTGAKHIAQKKDFPELYRIVENLTIAAGLPMPKVYVINDQQPNAFATGRNKEHAVVAVTAGLLQILDKSELEGVLAHELSHIGNRDMLISTIVAVLVGIIGMISDLFIRMSWWGRGGREERDDNRRGSDIMFVIGIAGMVLAPIAATLIQLAVSRKREFLADANAVLITRFPEGLAGALEKISQAPVGSRYAHSTTAHLYFSNPFKADNRGQKTSWLVNMFSPPPPIQERIAVLRKMGS